MPNSVYAFVDFPIRRLLRLKMQEWKRSDKISLMGKLMMYEAMLHWVWFVMLAIAVAVFDAYVSHDVVLWMILLCTSFIVIIWLMYQRVPYVNHDIKKLYWHQLMMMVVYSLYLCTVLWQIGTSSFVTGVSLMGGIMLGLLLVERRLIWWMLWLQMVVLVLLMFIPLIFPLPTLYKSPTFHPTVYSGGYIVYEANPSIVKNDLFWLFTYLYFGLPKIITLVFTAGRLLDNVYEKRESIRHKAEYDELTGLRNRRSLFEYARRSLSEGSNESDHSLLLMDLDHFKQVNDVYGHLTGDKALQSTANVLKNNLPKQAVFGRYGGEEFMILLPNTNQMSAISIANELRTTLSTTPLETGDNCKIVMTASFGVATIDSEFVELIQEVYQLIRSNDEHRRQFHVELNEVIQFIIKQADTALYQAKYYGRNRVITSRVLDKNKMAHLASGFASIMKNDIKDTEEVVESSQSLG